MKDMQHLLDATPHDGQPFGLGLGDTVAPYILVMNASGSVDLYAATKDGGVGQRLGHAPASMWPAIASAVEFDFNLRMADAGKPAGSWPEPGGTVRLHPCFGRELEVALIVGTESFQWGPRLLSDWLEMKGTTRLAMWRKWQAVAQADPAEEARDLVHVVFIEGGRVNRLSREHRQRIDALCRYVLQGEQAALDVVFEVAAMSHGNRYLVQKAVDGAFGDDAADMRLLRRKQVGEAMAAAVARRAEIAAMKEAA